MAVRGVYNVNQMAQAIADVLAEYSQVSSREIEEISKSISKRAVLKLKATSPVDTGDYRTGWRAKKLENGKWVVHNATDYRLTHLLEKGHAKVGGGRVGAREHIGLVEREVIEDFEREIREVLGG